MRAIGEAAAPQALLTGGPALTAALPENFRRLGSLPLRADAGALPAVTGPGAVIAGSRPPATLAQIGRARANDLRCWNSIRSPPPMPPR